MELDGVKQSLMQLIKLTDSNNEVRSIQNPNYAKFQIQTIRLKLKGNIKVVSIALFFSQFACFRTLEYVRLY